MTVDWLLYFFLELLVFFWRDIRLVTNYYIKRFGTCEDFQNLPAYFYTTLSCIGFTSLVHWRSDQAVSSSWIKNHLLEKSQEEEKQRREIDIQLNLRSSSRSLQSNFQHYNSPVHKSHLLCVCFSYQTTDEYLIMPHKYWNMFTSSHAE